MLGAADLKRGTWLLANGSSDSPPVDAADFDLFGSNPLMFEGDSGPPQSSVRRESRREDLLSPQEISQVSSLLTLWMILGSVR